MQYFQMGNLNNLGINVFEQLKELEWEEEIVFFNLLSALSWKKFHGPIHLYCNEKYLETLTKWGVDTVFDVIDTSLLKDKPNTIDYNQFWAFSKLWIIKKLSPLKKFTVLDTDLFLGRPLILRDDIDVLFYHKENFDPNQINSTYPDFDVLLPSDLQSQKLDKSVLPMNCAILHVNNVDFIDEWVDTAEKIAIHSKDIKLETNISSAKMCFVEQRLLPMILKNNNYTYDSFIVQSYQSHLSDKMDGSEWFPRLENCTKEQNSIFESIKHVWGLKKIFHKDEVHFMVLYTAMMLMKPHSFIGKPYENLIRVLLVKLSQLESKLPKSNHNLA